jgi:hypothetical protein
VSDLHTRFHEAWLGMVQPTEGLVVSVPVLVDAQCMERHGPGLQERLRELCPVFDAESGVMLEQEVQAKGRKKRETLEQKLREGRRRYRDLGDLVREFLEWPDDRIDEGEALPENLSRYIAEGHQTIRPTMGLRRLEGSEDEGSKDGVPDIETPESEAGKGYVALVWELPAGLAFDKPETETGDWRYPPAAKFDRLLRACRVPIGFLTNGEAVRLVYAPHGEATGSITFDLTDMGETLGRPILDAFVMLAHGYRFFGVAEAEALPALLRVSRDRQANVTNTLAGQVFEALDLLLRGFEAAARRDARADLRALLELADGDDPDVRRSRDDHLYGGLLTVLLRLVFLLYAEDRELLPTDNEHYLKSLSLSQLFEDLQRDHGAFPDTMNRRFGAWPRLLALFRCIYDGVEHGDCQIPRRRGELFDPSRFPFLETWGLPTSAVPGSPGDRAATEVPTIDDETVYRVLERLMILEGQRLSYKVLDVEQIGSVYEALMGYGVVSFVSPAVCCPQPKSVGGVWIEAAAVLEQKPGNRAKFLREQYGVAKNRATKIAKELKAAGDEAGVLEALEKISLKKAKGVKGRRVVGQLALQPGEERRRTSSHYTPRSLSEPIVRRTLEPLLVAMSETGEPSSDQLLSLKICDPAMGSGAFLVEACRFLGDHVVAAWEREGQVDKIASAKEDVVVHARRLVAQRCLYGVDKNPFAVSLAKLSLWLVTLARDEPFTFVDHCLRHGDSLVGLSFEQIKAFHWKPDAQMDFIEKELETCVEESVALRQQILELAGDSSPGVTRLKEQLLWDANDALARVRLIGDLVVGAFFEHGKDKERKATRTRRLDLVRGWLAEGGDVPEELRVMAERVRAEIPVFHWTVEMPEVFYGERGDPLDDGQVNRAALMDAFVGNPPFLGGRRISGTLGDNYSSWLEQTHDASKNSDLCSHFFRTAGDLLGHHGTIGLVATNTIAQGDTRASGLKVLLARGHRIYNATRSLLWPGSAAVAVSIVHLAKGAVPIDRRLLDGEYCTQINSRLRPTPERPDPVSLRANQNKAFQGCVVRGAGFVLAESERDNLVNASARNSEVIKPFLGGEEVNTHPRQEFHRWIINYRDLSLDTAATWPEVLSLVEERVRPEREKARGAMRQPWWQLWRPRPTLYNELAGKSRCLVASIVTKHLTFSFQPTDRVFSHRLYVFPFEANAHFALLQSRIHIPWAWLLSSTLEERLNYSASDCFETFPFPPPETLRPDGPLNHIGRQLYEARAARMVAQEQGLTTTYNQLKDPDCTDPEIQNLRDLHLAMDRAVLAAYGWDEIDPPPYTDPVTPADHRAKEAFEDEVIDRLFALNAERAAEERIRGLTSKHSKRMKPSKPRKSEVST